MRTVMFRLLLLIIITLFVKKPFISSDSVCYSFYNGATTDTGVMLVYESLFQLQSTKGLSLKPKLALTLLLLLAGDIESCPGPERSIPELEPLLKTRGMHIFHQNVRNLLKNMDYIVEFIKSFQKIQILTLSETHIKNNVEYGSVFDIPGYDFISRPRKSGLGGGVAAYIQHGINWKRRTDLENDFLEYICVEIFPKNSKSFIVITMYRPPDSSKHLHENFNIHFAQLLSQVNDVEAIVLGDLNVNFLNKLNNKEIKSILQLYGFEQLINIPTRFDEENGTKSLIDIIATNHPITIKKSGVIPTCISDHEMIGFVRKVNHVKYKPKTIHCRDYKNYDPNKLNEHLKNQDWSKLYEYKNINDAWTFMRSILQTSYNIFCPMITKKVKGKPSPWITAELKLLMNDRDKLLRKWRKVRSKGLKDQLKAKRNRVNIEIRNAKSSYTKSLLQENANDPASFWSCLKKVFPVKNKVGHVENSFMINGRKEINRKKICEGFCEYFSTVVTKLKHSVYPMTNFVWKKPCVLNARTFNRFRFGYVSTIEIRSLLKKIKRNKAPGPDNLPPNLIKDSLNILAEPLAFLINLSLSTGMFPNEWKVARVVPVYKNGATDRLENYRPISALPVVSKIIEKIIHRRLIEYLEQSNLLTNRQFGFRRKRSTELAATMLIDDIRRSVDSKKLVGCVFIDFSKAFDTLSHSKLISKLSAYGIADKELAWFTSYLFHRQQLIKYDGCLSQPCSVTSGVPQGSILGPLLFLIFVNDITDKIKNSKVIMYADDTVLYADGADLKTIENALSSDMSLLASWFTENELLLNLKKGKTEAMVFGTGKKLSMIADTLEIKYNEHIINVTTSYKYLGVKLDRTLTLNDHFDSTYKKSASRLFLLAKLRYQLTSKAAKTIYETMVLPVLTYCCLVCLYRTETQIKRLSSLENRAQKIINHSDEKILSILQYQQIRACKFVRSCLDEEICDNFYGYFEKIESSRNTRNNRNSLKLPRVRTEFAKKSSYFMAAKIFNSLPLEIRKEGVREKFYSQVENFYTS